MAGLLVLPAAQAYYQTFSLTPTQWPTQWSQRISRQGGSVAPPSELQWHSHTRHYQGPAMHSSSCPLCRQFESRAHQWWSHQSCVLVLGFGTPDWSSAVPRVWVQSRLMTSLDAVPPTWVDCFWDGCIWNWTGDGPELSTGGIATDKSESRGSRGKQRSPPWATWHIAWFTHGLDRIVACSSWSASMLNPVSIK